MCKPNRHISNSRGQFVLEAILLMTVTAALFLGAVKYLEDSGFFTNFIGKPSKALAGVIESGNLVTGGGTNPVESARARHPNQDLFMMSTLGDGDL